MRVAEPGLVFLVIAIVGTTIAPWQLFFQQSCVAEKRLRFDDLKWAQLDTLIGALFTVCVAGAMMPVGSYGYEHKIVFEDPAQLRFAFGPIAGYFVRNGLLLLMVNAAVLGTTIIFLQLLLNDRELLGERWGQPAVEQLHQLGDHPRPLCPVTAAGRAGDAYQSLSEMSRPMATVEVIAELKEWSVVHPLHDVAEQKCSSEAWARFA